MIDAHHLDGMLKVGHDVEDVGLAMLTQEAMIDGGLCHTSLGSEGAHLIVGEIARMVAEGTGTAVTAHDGHPTKLKGIVEAALSGMTEIDENTQTVHLGDNLTPEVAHAAMGLRTLGRVADIIVAIVAEGHIDDAAIGEVLQIRELTVEGDAVLDAEHDRLESLALVVPEVIGGAGERNSLCIVVHERLYLVEDMISVCSGVLRGLREVGHHDRCVLAPFVHLMEINEDARVALPNLHTFVEEHRGVAMRVEGEHAVVGLMRCPIVGGMAHEPLEQRSTSLEALRMPLDTDDGFELAALYRLDDAVGGAGTDPETGSRLADGLVVERVDE